MKTKILLSAVLLPGLIATSMAANRTWTGTNGTSWSDSANWGGTAPATDGTDFLYFSGSNNTTTSNDFTGATFDGGGTYGLAINSATGFDLGGNSIILKNDIQLAGAAKHAINFDMAVEEADLLINTTGTNNAAQYKYINGTISETGTGVSTVTIANSATSNLVLLGNNTFDVDYVRVLNGFLRANTIGNATEAGNLGKTPLIVLGNATTGANLVYLGVDSDTDRQIKIGNGSAATHAGGATLTSANGNLTFTNSAFNVLDAGATANRTLTLGGASGGAILGVIADNSASGKIALTGANGVWRLAGNNTYSGGTNIGATSWMVGHNNAFGTGAITNDAGYYINLEDNITVSNPITFLNNSTANPGTIRLAAGATAATWAGNITNSALSGANNNGVALAADTNQTLTVSGNIGGTGNASVRKQGAGVVLLTGNNTYTADTIISNGVLRYGVANALPSTNVTVAAGAGLTATLDLDGYNGTIGALTLGATGANATSTHQVTTGSGTLKLGGNVTYIASGNPANSGLISGKLDLGADNRSFTVNDSSGTAVDLDVTADISSADGTFGINKLGAGTLRLAGSNSYTGNTAISAAGVVIAAHNNALGTGGVTLGTTGAVLELEDGIDVANALTVSNTGAGKVLRLQNGASSGIYAGNITISEATGGNFDIGVETGNFTISGAIGGSGGAGIEKVGNGTLIVASNNTFTGPTTITAGTVRVGTGGGSGSLNNGTLTNNGELIYNRTGTLTTSSAIGGTGNLTKMGSGTLVLQGNSSYSGLTTISQGTVILDTNTTTLGSTAGGTIVASGAQLRLTDTNFLLEENLTLSGIGTGASGAGNGALGMQVNAGIITYNGSITLDGGATIGTFNSGTADLTITQGIGGTGDLTLRPGAANNGRANFYLLGQSSYTGNTVFSTANVSGLATVQNRIDNALPTGSVLFMNGTVGNATAQLAYVLGGYNQTLAGLQGGASSVNAFNFTMDQYVTGGNAALSTLTINNTANFTFSGTLGGNNTDDNNLALVKSGAGVFTLNGTNTYAGGTRIENGALAVGTGGSTGTLGTGEVSNNATLAFYRNNAYTVEQGISGSGTLYQLGTGSTTLNATNTYTGATNVYAGTLVVGANGTVNNTSGINVLASATLEYLNTGTGLTQNVTLSGGTFRNNGAAFTGLLTGNGTITGSGDFNTDITLAANDILSPGNSPGTLGGTNQTWAPGGTYLWEINDATGTQGGDPGWDFTDLSDTLYITASAGNEFTIQIVSLDLFNSPGDAANFNELSNYTWVIATAANGATGFDASDFNLDLTGFNNTYSGTWGIQQTGNNIELVYTAIPEPSTWVLLGLGIGGIALLRRQARKQGKE